MQIKVLINNTWDEKFDLVFDDFISIDWGVNFLILDALLFLNMQFIFIIIFLLLNAFLYTEEALFFFVSSL